MIRTEHLRRRSGAGVLGVARPRRIVALGRGGVPRTAGVSSHLAASICAATAGLSALLHHIIAGTESLAVFGAAVANFSANRADAAMVLGITEHEICGGLAYLGTVEQQRNMLRPRMIASLV